MAYALVGTIGVASQGASGAAVTPAWGTGESRTAGNLLICFCSVTGNGTNPAIPSGWSQSGGVAGTSCSVTIFTKIAAGGDTAPTLAAVTGGVIAAQLAEFSGNSPTPLDHGGSVIGTTSPLSTTFNGIDVASGELVIIVSADFRSTARATNDTLTSNNATITQAGNNNGTSSVNHYSFGYSLGTTSNAAADTAVLTASITTSITGMCVLGVSFKFPQSLLRTCTDAPTTSEAITRKITRFATDAPTTSETARSIGPRTATDAPHTAEAVNRSPLLPLRTATDAPQTSELAITPQHLSKTATDAPATREIFGLSDGDPVSTWPDSSGNGNNATQTGSARPTFKIVSGSPLVRFSTAITPQTLNIPTAIPDAGWTVIVVMASAGVSGSGLNMASLGSTLNYGTAGPHMYLDGSWQIDAGGVGYTDGSSDTAFHVWSGTSTPALFCDGTSRTLGTGTYYGGGSINVIGARYLQYADGDIKEIVAYNVVLGSTDRANIEAGLAAKWGLTVAGGTPVTPDSVAGLAAWWKADSLRSSSAVSTRGVIRIDTELLYGSDAPSLNDGDTVTTWPDSTGLGHYGTNIGSPKFKKNIVNGLPVVRLSSASSDAFNLASVLTGVTPWTVFMVMKPATLTSTIWSLSSTGDIGCVCAPGGNFYAINRVNASSFPFDGSVFHVFTATSWGAFNLRLDGVSPSGVSGVGGTFTGDFTTIGYRASDGNYSDGDIAEILYFNDNLGDVSRLTDRQNVEATLAAKYGTPAPPAGSVIDISTLSALQGWWKADSLLTIAPHAIRILNTSRSPTDHPVTSESPVRILSLLRTDTDHPVTSESASKIQSYGRASIEAISTAEIATRILAALRTTADSPILAESLIKVLGSKRTTTEAISTSEAIARIIAVLRTTIDHPFTSESAARMLAASRTAVDSITTADAAVRIETVLRTAIDALSTAEVATAVRPGGPLSRTAADALSTSESVIRLLSAIRSCSDNPTLAESLQRTLTLLRTTTDAPVITEALNRLITLFRTTSDHPVLSESLIRSVVFLRTVADNPTISESATRLLILLRSVTDGLSISEIAIGSKFGVLARTAIDSLLVAESVARVLVLLRTGIDALSISESIVRTTTQSRITTDSLLIAQVVSRLVSQLRSTTDALNLSEVLVRSIGASRSTIDAPAIAQVVTRILILLRTAIDSLTTADVVAKLTGPVRTGSDALTIAESVSRLVALLRATTDNPVLAEAVARILAAKRNGTDALSTSDIVVQRPTHLLFASDALTISETARRILSASRNGTDVLNISESLIKTGAYSRTLVDALFISDLTGIAQGAQRSTLESLLTSEDTSLSFLLNRLATDFLHVSDVARPPFLIRLVTELLRASDVAVWNIPRIIKILVALELARQINIVTTQDLLGLKIQNIVEAMQPVNIVIPTDPLAIDITLGSNPTLIDILVTGRN